MIQCSDCDTVAAERLGLRVCQVLERNKNILNRSKLVLQVSNGLGSLSLTGQPDWELLSVMFQTILAHGKCNYDVWLQPQLSHLH